MIRKIFGGIKMTWPRLILFAVISGLITGLVALLVPEGNSFRQIAVTLEAWIVLAIIVVVNCDKPLEAACKTFVYFLISQPLVYLVQVPFNSMGFGLFKYYYPYWFWWTVATLPGGFIAWFIKRDDWIAALILSVALCGLILFGTGYLADLIRTPPKFLVSTLFCYGSVPVLILCILHKRNPRLIAAGISIAALIVLLILQFRGGINNRNFQVSFGLDEEKYPVTAEWKVRLEDPENGTASLYIGEGIISSAVTVQIKDLDKPAGVYLTDPEGNEYYIPAIIEKDGNGVPSVIY
ncbi:MAG: hypothetical protein IJQ71_01370 [Clostridia bacterium]|nr:hypothetical protein [Clostridia bacterium]